VLEIRPLKGNFQVEFLLFFFGSFFAAFCCFYGEPIEYFYGRFDGNEG
jgi:hypothetical protein